MPPIAVRTCAAPRRSARSWPVVSSWYGSRSHPAGALAGATLVRESLTQPTYWHGQQAGDASHALPSALAERVRSAIRLRHLSPSTEQAYFD